MMKRGGPLRWSVKLPKDGLSTSVGCNSKVDLRTEVVNEQGGRMYSKDTHCKKMIPALGGTECRVLGCEITSSFLEEYILHELFL